MTADFKLLNWQEKVEKARLKGATHIWIKAGRKTGKTEYIRHVLQETCKTPARVPDQINAYIAPARNQAKNILWRRLKAMNRELIDGRPRETELAIDYRNGVRLQLFGADNEDGVRGLTFGPSILDEADYMRVGFYEEVVEPNGSAKSSDLDIAMPLIVDFYIKVKDEYDAAIAAETQKKQAKEAKSGTATFVIPKALIDPKVKPK